MFDKVLVANRGEIARRVFRTCRAMGIATVAVHSDADAGAAFVDDADEAVGLGGHSPAESYLRIDAIVDAARRSGAEAVHPGYGFLAENADFARAVLDAGMVFIGPPPDVIAAMGSKLEAKRRMAEAGVPLLPSAALSGLDDRGVAAAGKDIGFPLLVKASAGGGGRGMRIVDQAPGLAEAVAGAAREAESAFGDGTIYAERYVPTSRHVEVQIFGDDHGRVIHLQERECSIQRRHQKIVEEAPSPALDERTRSELHLAAVRAGEAIGYRNAGTVEFLLAPDGEFFFLEVNTRLQVEHPVTEAILGLDLVRLQLEVASGSALPPQDEVGPVRGHAIEVRLYAEDSTADFRPTTGRLHRFEVPEGVRVDTAYDRDGGAVTHHYDPMLAKVVSHAPTRAEAARVLAARLAEARLHGVVTNRELLVRILRHPEFLAGQTDTAFLERHDPASLGAPLPTGHLRTEMIAAAALARQAERRAHAPVLASLPSGWRNVATQPQQSTYRLDGADHEVRYRYERGVLAELAVDGVALERVAVHDCSPDLVDLSADGLRRRHLVHRVGTTVWVDGPGGGIALEEAPRFVEPESQVDPGSLVAPMPGTVVAVEVKAGDTVVADQILVVLEAMKMELAIRAPVSGTVAAVGVEAGQTVEAGAMLAVIDDGSGE